MPKVQTTSVKNADNRGVVGEVVCVLGAMVSVVVAVLAAGPLCWQHEPFNAQLNPIGGMVGSLPKPPPIGLTRASKGPRCPPAGFRPPPIGLTCASKGPACAGRGPGHHLSGERAGHRANMRVKVLTCAGCVHRNRRGPDGSQASRRSPCLLGYDGGGTPKGPASRCVRWPRRRR